VGAKDTATNADRKNGARTNIFSYANTTFGKISLWSAVGKNLFSRRAAQSALNIPEPIPTNAGAGEGI
jgi:hypothetical protein